MLLGSALVHCLQRQSSPGFVPESAWILHCKEQFGLVAQGTAPEENPCPPEKRIQRGRRQASSTVRARITLADQRVIAYSTVMPTRKDPTNFTVTVHIPEALG